MYAEVSNGKLVRYPVTLEDVKAERPGVSFPDPLDRASLDFLSLVEVKQSQRPEPSWDEDLVEGDPVLDGAVWRKTWRVVRAPEHRIGTRLRRQWEIERRKRDALLAASDWTQLADSPVDKAAWAEYRRALRDLPETFPNPFTIEWPEKPV